MSFFTAKHTNSILTLHIVFDRTGHQDRRYPYLSDTPLTESQEQIAIIGELYRVKNSEIPKLDELEEHPVYYRRRETKILNLIEGSETEAFIYILFSEKIIGDIKRDFTTRFEDVTSGDWRRHGGI